MWWKVLPHQPKKILAALRPPGAPARQHHTCELRLLPLAANPADRQSAWRRRWRGHGRLRDGQSSSPAAGAVSAVSAIARVLPCGSSPRPWRHAWRRRSCRPAGGQVLAPASVQRARSGRLGGGLQTLVRARRARAHQNTGQTRLRTPLRGRRGQRHLSGREGVSRTRASRGCGVASVVIVFRGDA